MDLNGGVTNNDASNARILTNLVVHAPKLSSKLPSMAEALSVLASSTLVVGSLDTTYRHYWNDSYASHLLDPPVVSNTRCSLLPLLAPFPPVVLPLRFVSGVLA